MKRVKVCIAKDYAPRESARVNRVAKIRIRDLEIYLSLRYGTAVPDDDAGREDLVILLNHVAQNPNDPYGKMVRTVRAWAPQMLPEQADQLIIAQMRESIRTLALQPLSSNVIKLWGKARCERFFTRPIVPLL